MVRAAATWTNTDKDAQAEGELIWNAALFLLILQRVEHLAQIHNHDRDTANSGGPLRLSSAPEIWLLMGATNG